MHALMDRNIVSMLRYATMILEYVRIWCDKTKQQQKQQSMRSNHVKSTISKHAYCILMFIINESE